MATKMAASETNEALRCKLPHRSMFNNFPLMTNLKCPRTDFHKNPRLQPYEPHGTQFDLGTRPESCRNFFVPDSDGVAPVGIRYPDK